MSAEEQRAILSGTAVYTPSVAVDPAQIWCPYACVLDVTGNSGNRQPSGEPFAGTRCLGPRCGMWDAGKGRPGC